MPRNGSGSYQLPAGNPVTSGTLIEASWANTTLSDLASAMTDSLARSGEGGMTGPLRVTDGSVSVPSLSFVSETSTGFYRAGATDVRFAMGGVDVATLTTAGVTVGSTKVLALPDGSAAAPALTNTGDTNTGAFFPAEDTVGVSTGGTERVRVDASGNVGIGTTSPAYKLDVQQAGDTTGRVRNTNTGAGAFSQIVLETSNTFTAGSTAYVRGVSLNPGNADIALTFGTSAGTGGATEKMRLDSSGNLGLGVTPSAWWSNSRAIQLSAGAAISGRTTDSTIAELSANQFLNASGVRTYLTTNPSSLYELNSGRHIWYTAPSGTAGNPITFTQAMTLDANGNLGVGTATPASKIHAEGAGVNIRLKTTGAIGSGSQCFIQFDGSEGDSGYFGFGGAANTMDVWNRRNGVMTFGTNNNERARITSDGGFLVGCTVPPSASTVGYAVGVNDGFGDVCFSFGSGITTPDRAFAFFNPNGMVGSIVTSGSSTAFNTSSDVRLKQDIQPANDAAALIDAIQIRQFNWKADGAHQRYGVIAQELDPVFPEAVSKTDNPDAMLGVDYSKLVPLLIKEIQSLRTRIAALEAAA